MALTLQSKEHKKFKLAFPLKFKRKNSELIVTDKFSVSHTIELEQLDEVMQKSPDCDGFTLFEVSYVKPTKPNVLTPQVEAGINGYNLFHSSVPLSKGHGTTKSVYEYYKRNRDLSYYALIKKEGSEPQKILLGSLLDRNSRLQMMARVIDVNFRMTEPFSRSLLDPYLPSYLSNRRVMKCVLDVFLVEEFIERSKIKYKSIIRRGKMAEYFRKTDKLPLIVADPRSFLKPNGANVGQRALTSDQ